MAIIYFLFTRDLGPQTFAPEGIGARQVVMTFLFLHGLGPDSINSVVPGGWSVAAEMLFYLIFPALYIVFDKITLGVTFIFSIWAIFVCVLLNHVVSNLILSFAPESQPIWRIFVYYWLPQQMPCFFFGMLVFKMSQTSIYLSRTHATYLLSAAVIIMLIVPFLPEHQISIVGLQTIYGAMFACFTFALHYCQPAFLTTRPVEWMGKVSFSAYLIHFALIPLVPLMQPFGIPTLDYLFIFVAICAPTMALSACTYLVIEKPMIDLGNRLIKILRLEGQRQNRRLLSGMNITAKCDLSA